MSIKASLIICTKDRAKQLEKCLNSLIKSYETNLDVEVVLVDNGSTDETPKIIQQFKNTSPWQIVNVIAGKAGLGYARNYGIKASSGEVLIFTDDDCYLEEKFFSKFFAVFNPQQHQFGGGSIILFNQDDDSRVANMLVQDKVTLPPYTTVIPAGQIQGANMFFMRKVFEKAGYFDENLGAGTNFPCEDIEMACRASQHGFTGAVIPGFNVFHDHGRKTNSIEAERTVKSYDVGRGAYYGVLLSRGVREAWEFWGERTAFENLTRAQLEQLQLELSGAASYLEFALKKPNWQPEKHKEKLPFIDYLVKIMRLIKKTVKRISIINQ